MQRRVLVRILDRPCGSVFTKLSSKRNPHHLHDVYRHPRSDIILPQAKDCHILELKLRARSLLVINSHFSYVTERCELEAW